MAKLPYPTREVYPAGERQAPRQRFEFVSRHRRCAPNTSAAQRLLRFIDHPDVPCDEVKPRGHGLKDARNRAREGWGFRQYARHRVLRCEGRFRASPFAPGVGLPHLTLNGWPQAGQVPLQDVILSTGFHGGDGEVLADGAGDKNEGRVLVTPPQQLQGVSTREVRHPEITDDDVPDFAIQGGLYGLGRVYPLGPQLIARPRQFTRNEQRVVLGILDQEEAQRTVHVRASGGAGGARFTSNQ